MFRQPSAILRNAGHVTPTRNLNGCPSIEGDLKPPLLFKEFKHGQDNQTVVGQARDDP